MNSELVKLKDSGDLRAEYTIERCTSADNLSELKFVLGDTSINKKIKVYYQHIIKNKSNPTLVFLAGGPGGYSIGDSEDFEHLEDLLSIGKTNALLKSR